MRNPKKVLHILKELKFSGAEVMLKVAAPTFAKRDISISILATGEELGGYYEVLKQHYNISHIPFKKDFLASLKHYFKLYKFLKNNKFDVIHCHVEQTFFWYSFIASMAKVKRKIYSIHNTFHFLPFLVRVKRAVYRFCASRFLNVKFLAVSPSVIEVERQFFLNNRTYLTYNWINSSFFLPLQHHEDRIKLRQKWGIPSGSFVTISISLCIKQKRIEDIIEAASKVKKGDMDYFHIHVGDGVLKEKLIALTDTFGIKDSVLFTGSQSNVRDLLIISDLFLMTSEYEGLGNVVLEAMSCGIPAVVYNVYGLRDLVKDGTNGLIIPESPQALSDAVSMLKNNREKLNEMSRSTRERFLTEFNEESLIDKWIEKYN